MPALENDVPNLSDGFPVAEFFNRTGSLLPFAAPSTKVRSGPFVTNAAPSVGCH
jgi:hypothetical protein